jgi:hypothetical protein
MRRIIFTLSFLIVFIGSVYSVDEYRIGETIKIYDEYLEEIQSRITYYPAAFYHFENAIFLYFNKLLTYTLIFDKDLRVRFSGILDKCIEWTAVAKKNDVHELSRMIEERVGIFCVFPTVSNYPDVLIIDYIFSIQKIKGKEEIMLVMNYKTVDQINNGRPGGYIAIKQNDFNRLKEIFSDNYLANYDKKAEEQAKIENLFH